MLVLTRGLSESIRIGDNITVTMIAVKKDGTAVTEVAIGESTDKYEAYRVSRKINGVIMIQDDPEISILIVEVRDGKHLNYGSKAQKVRYGITCPRDIPVHRQEVYLAIQRENERQRKAQG